MSKLGRGFICDGLGLGILETEGSEKLHGLRAGLNAGLNAGLRCGIRLRGPPVLGENSKEDGVDADRGDEPIDEIILWR